MKHCAICDKWFASSEYGPSMNWSLCPNCNVVKKEDEEYDKDGALIIRIMLHRQDPTYKEKLALVKAFKKLADVMTIGDRDDSM